MKKFISLMLSIAVMAGSLSVTVLADTANSQPVGGVYPVEGIECTDNIDIDSYVYKPSDGGSEVMALSATPDWLTQRSYLLYDYLGEQDNGAEKQAFYNKVFDSLSAFANDEYAKPVYYSFTTTGGTTYSGNYIFVSADEGSSLSHTDANAVYNAVLLDNPQFYFVGASLYGKASTAYIGADVKSDYISGSVRVAQNDVITASVAEYDEVVDPNMSNYVIEKTVHNKLIADNSYKYDSNGNPSETVQSHSIIGSLDPSEGGGVCESYAKAFKLLLNRYDVPCYYLAGIAYSGSGSGGHAWNCVQLADGNYYYVDVTWDDVRGTLPYYKYFNMPASTFTSSHVVSSDYMSYVEALPTCSDNTTYYSSNAYTAPNVDESETRTTTERQTEATTVEESTETTSYKSYEYSTEATTNAAQKLFDGSYRSTVAKPYVTSDTNVTLGTFSDVDAPFAMFSGNSKFCFLINGRANFSLRYGGMNSGSEINIYVDDTLYKTMVYSGGYEYNIVLPMGSHKITVKATNGTYIYGTTLDYYGDIDADGELSILDSVLYQSNDTYDYSRKDILDADGNGIVNNLDYAYVLRMAAGISV